jgi:hypothetical protein
VIDAMWADWLKRYLCERPWAKDQVRLDTLREGLRRIGAA